MGIMDVIIRDYRQGDQAALVRCMESLLDYLGTIDPRKRIRRLPTYGEKYLASLLKRVGESEGWIGVADMDNKIVGCIAVVVDRKDELEKLQYVPSPTGEVLDLYVDQTQRGKGIGQNLIEAAEAYVRSKGCDAMNIEVFVPNTLAHDFYKKCGYEDRVLTVFKLLPPA